MSAEQLGELLAQPEMKVNFAAANLNIPPVKHTLGPEFSGGPHIDLIRHQFTRRLPTIVGDLHAELQLALQEQWPSKTREWTPVKVKPTCMSIVRQATNRVLCGSSLCRNSEFLSSMGKYFDAVVRAAGVITLCPAALHPFIVPFLQWQLRRWQKACVKHTEPIIEKRLADLRYHENSVKTAGDPGNGDSDEPNDALQWLLRQGVQKAKTDGPQELDPNLITLRLLVWNILSIHTLGMTITTTLLDLCSAPECDEYVAGLREECARIFAQHDGIWTDDALKKLVRVDSAIRESMRVSPLADIAVKRTITETLGITLSDGLHIPHGAMIAAPVYCLHHDSKFYPDRPGTYDAFRFSRPFEQERLDMKIEFEAPTQKHLAITTTKIEFLPFGYGKHACPGRFFAAMEIKLLLAHILLHYDVELRGARPENVRTAQSNVPGDKAELWIKRREKTP